MPDTNPNNLPAKAGLLKQANVDRPLDSGEEGARPASFYEWLDAKRELLASSNPEVAARLAEVHDEAGFRDLLKSPDGNSIIAILIGAKATTPDGEGNSSVWDDTDIVHVIEGQTNTIVGDWNGDGRDTVGLTGRGSSGLTFDDDAPSTLLDMRGPLGEHRELRPMEHLAVTVDGQSGDDMVEVESLLETDSDA